MYIEGIGYQQVFIQEIKNSARIYVHRIGFDPPPIKEDRRLTGKLKFNNKRPKRLK